MRLTSQKITQSALGTRLNDIIGGFRPGALYIIGARPGIGKTIVGLQIAWALVQDRPCELPQP
jgi:replicative DNA helicase